VIEVREIELGGTAEAAPAMLELRPRWETAEALVEFIDKALRPAGARRSGHGEQLMEWLTAEAARLGCEGLHLDSGVGADRAPAHRLYMRNGLRISAHHLEREI
jgi:GNAT superfamily N-acetyltransferase